MGGFLVGCMKDGNPGIFGDFFGVLNPLVSIAAAALVVYTIRKSQETDEAEEKRHDALVTLQEKAATAQKEQADVALITANLQAHASNFDFLNAELALNEEFIRDHGQKLRQLVDQQPEVSFKYFAFKSAFPSKDAGLPFVKAAQRIHGMPLELSKPAHEVASQILASYIETTKNLRANIDAAVQLRSHYTKRLLERDKEAETIAKDALRYAG